MAARDVPMAVWVSSPLNSTRAGGTSTPPTPVAPVRKPTARQKAYNTASNMEHPSGKEKTE